MYSWKSCRRPSFSYLQPSVPWFWLITSKLMLYAESLDASANSSPNTPPYIASNDWWYASSYIAQIASLAASVFQASMLSLMIVTFVLGVSNAFIGDLSLGVLVSLSIIIPLSFDIFPSGLTNITKFLLTFALYHPIYFFSCCDFSSADIL